jgi:hypothetical protein
MATNATTSRQTYCNIPTAEFGMISAETACWDIERNSQIFDEDFYWLLYLPLCLRGSTHSSDMACIGDLHHKMLITQAAAVDSSLQLRIFAQTLGMTSPF